MTESRISTEGAAGALEFFATCPKGFEPLLADELASRGHDVRFFGETRRLEGKLVPEA